MIERELINLINKLNIYRKVAFEQDKDNRRAFIGNVTVENESYHMKIFFPDAFPIKLPEITIIDANKRFAHMGIDGKLCLLDESSILIQSSMPDQIVIDCYDKAITNISIDINSEYYAREVLREFNSYWIQNANLKIYSFLEELNSGYIEVPMYISRNIHVIASSVLNAKYYACNYLNVFDDDKAYDAKCLLISLRSNSRPICLKKDYKWSEIRKYILKNVTGSVKRQFQHFLNCSVSGFMKYIVISIPGECGNILFGFRIHFTNRKKEMVRKIITSKVDLVYVNRMDKTYMLQRSGIEKDISEKHVLLLGCGSVGGYIANNLCQMGVGSIDLLDNDIFTKENVYRHFLGFDALRNPNKYKAELLKERLEEIYPYADKDSLDYTECSVENYLQKWERLENYDLIISALGEPTLNLEINRILYKEKIATPFICCFNEPYGIGGHALAVNITHDTCLRCLYTDQISEDLVPFRASFVGKNQYFKKNISGCSGAFVPYSCLDSQQTAIMTARLAVKILLGEVRQNKICSWKGNDMDLINAGFKTSDFYQSRKANGMLEEMAVPFAEHCPVCHNV